MNENEKKELLELSEEMTSCIPQIDAEDKSKVLTMGARRIRELLAENEELRLGMKAWGDKWDHTAGRAEAAEADVAVQRKRGDEVIAVLRCLRDVCTTPGETKADFVERIKAVLGSDPDARVEALYAAEARLKALCEAEPVACISPAELAHLKRARSAIVIPADAAVADDLILIPRPSMEKN